MLFSFLSGAITMGFLLAGLMFLRFWKRTGEPLFVSFALAFWLLGISQALLVLNVVPVEERSWLYLLLLGAFALILVSVWRANRRT